MYIKPYLNCKGLPTDEIVLCYNEQNAIFWLELSCTDLIATGGQADQGATYYIGAVEYRGKSWTPVDATTVEQNRLSKIIITLTSQQKVHLFQRRIIDVWSFFNSNDPGNWVMGNTVSKSYTSASFVMKALETGMVTAGERGPYESSSLVRFADFSLKDLLKYIGAFGKGPVPASRRAELPIGTAALIGEFNRIPAHPFPTPEDAPKEHDRRPIKVIKSMKPLTEVEHLYGGGNFHYENDVFWNTRDININRATDAGGNIKRENVPYKQVIGYGFRGDTRNPDAIHYAGGFLPNYTRPDHIANAKKEYEGEELEFAVHDAEALDLARFLKDQRYGGFISTSKSYATAKHFVKTNHGGWIYACFVEGGFEITGRLFRDEPWEQELAKPGMIDWEDMVACRECSAEGSFKGPVYVRSNLKQQDPYAYVEIFELMSGKSQGS